MTVICELVGLPEEDRREFHRLTRVMGTVSAGGSAAPEEIVRVLGELVAIMRDLVAARRVAPTADLTGALVAARDGDDRLSEDELTSTLWLLVFAGHETTTNLIANSVRVLLAHPDQLALLRTDPGRWDSAVEEFLRFDGPSQILPRRATAAVDLGGVTIPAGDIVFSATMGANHDAAAHVGPEHFDIARSPNPHLAFGHGIHYCLGAPLARLEARIALSALFGRFPNLELAVDPAHLTLRRTYLLHGLTNLPVRLNPA